MPTKYLPKNKRVKLETSGKPKKPKSRDMDAWYEHHMEKEREQEIKKEKQEKKKKLPEEKKIYAAKMKELTRRIKEETN